MLASATFSSFLQAEWQIIAKNVRYNTRNTCWIGLDQELPPSPAPCVIVANLMLPESHANREQSLQPSFTDTPLSNWGPKTMKTYTLWTWKFHPAIMANIPHLCEISFTQSQSTLKAIYVSVDHHDHKSRWFLIFFWNWFFDYFLLTHWNSLVCIIKCYEVPFLQLPHASTVAWNALNSKPS